MEMLIGTKFEPGDLVIAASSCNKNAGSLPANSIIVFRELGKMFPDIGVGELLLREHGGPVFFTLATAKVIVHAGDAE
jgi:hypothetical protein